MIDLICLWIGRLVLCAATFYVVVVAWWIVGQLALRFLPWGVKRPWYTATLGRWIVTPTGVVILFALGGPLTVFDLPGDVMRRSTLKRKKREHREELARIQAREATH